jgi:outer membrane scaffolding protein for murein synthesis (MipA/OmpV family)
MKKLILWAVVAVLLPAGAAAAADEEKPAGGEKALWEVVVGGGAIYGPDYPASDEYHINGLALPYLIYRGDILRLGEDAIARAVALESDRFELDLSLDGAFNADSGDNEARRGMPDLDYLGEIGPQLTIHAARWDFGRAGSGTLDVNLQARLVASTDFSTIEGRGYVFEPEVVYNHRDFLGSKCNLYAAAAPIWASKELMDYFYQVDDEYVRADRPQYDAAAGYLGTEVKLGAGRKVTDRLYVYLGGNFGLHHGAGNQDSPLYKSDFTAAAAFGFIWTLFESEKTVRRRPAAEKPGGTP